MKFKLKDFLNYTEKKANIYIFFFLNNLINKLVKINIKQLTYHENDYNLVRYS